MLHFVDDVAAGAKRLITMWRANSDPDGNFAERQIADAMDTARIGDAEFAARFVDDALAFADGQRFEGFVLEASNFATFVEIAHPTLEGSIAAAGRVLQRSPQGEGIEIDRAELKVRHSSDQPPATGGMNTTESPESRGCSQEPNSSLIATRSEARSSVKP